MALSVPDPAMQAPDVPWHWNDGEMATRIRAFDWRSTPIGSIERWPAALRQAVATMLDSPAPMAIAWGPSGLLLYNDAHRDVAGTRHPRQLGLPLIEAWPEAEAFVDHILSETLAGRSLQLRGHPLELMRNGVPERALFDADYSPLRDEQGRPAGMLAIIRELTRESMLAAAREAGRHEAFLLALGDELRSLCAPADILRVASRRIGEHLGLDRVGLAADDPVGGLRVREGWSRDPRAPVLRLPDWVAEHGNVVSHDVERDTTFDAASRSALRMQEVAALVMTVRAGRGQQGASVFVAAARTPRHWTTAELNLLREVGERAGAASERAAAEIALTSSEQRYRAVVEQAGIGVAIADRDTRLVYVNEQYCRTVGAPREALVGKRIEELTHPEDWPESAALLKRVLDEGVANTVEKRIVVDGERYWLRLSVVPWRDADGEIVGSLAVSMDITGRRQAELSLRESEARFRQFSDASSDVLWIRNADTLALEYLSPAFEAIYGVAREAAIRDPGLWMSTVHADDLAEVRARMRKVRHGGRADFEFRVQRPSDGRTIWVRNTAFPLFDDAGRVQRIAGIGRDITAEREHAVLLETLVAELQHRTRNLIAVVQSLARRTLQGSPDLASFASRFRARLDALGRVQGLLSQGAALDRVTFDALLRQELEAHGVGEDDPRVTLDGPAGVPLRSRVVQTLALALHELTTNAFKHGALSDAGGQLDIRWEIVPGEAQQSTELRLTWHEHGVAGMAVADSVAGYGRELIEHALPYQLGARTTHRLLADGILCRIDVPLDGTRAILRERAA